MGDLAVEPATIPGLLMLKLPVHVDSRGWFKENWQREKMLALGLPDFHPVQNNVSFNQSVGTTRGIHAEPWDKLLTVVTGRIFGAWVDLRDGDTFGSVVTAELDASRAVFVPRGVGNSFQTLEPHTAVSYLVNAHWTAEAEYTFLNLADETVAIEWPIPLDEVEVSPKDLDQPRLAEVVPVLPRRTLILGASGQVGRALMASLPGAVAWSRPDFDITNRSAYEVVDWNQFDVIINAAAYTHVDEAENLDGRRAAWRVNVSAVVELAKVAIAHDITLVHLSSDYVFDGEHKKHTPDEGFSPLGVYGQTKAAADAVVGTVPKHYIVRTSWVIGDGSNFIRTMQLLAARGVDPQVVDDQFGRLTYATDLADSIVELLRGHAEFGVHHITSGGDVKSWYDIARDAFAAVGHDPDRVVRTTTAHYGADKQLAPRPSSSVLEP